MRKNLIISGVAGAAAAGVLAGVFWTAGGSGADRVGPLGGGPVEVTQCVPLQSAAIGLSDLRNTTTSPIQIEKFSLVGPHDVRLLGVDLAPVVAAPGAQTVLVGAGGPYPVSAANLAGTVGVVWNARRALPMTMPPDKPGHSWNLVFGLERTAAAGSVSYYQLQYEWQGQQYTWSSQIAVRLTGKCS
jgi:hypothetical protein